MAKAKRHTERIKVRWPAGWTAIPNRIIRDTGLSRNARLTWALLATFAGNDESAWPSQDTLCEMLGEELRTGEVSRRSIHRWTSELWFAGWLTITRTRYGHEYELHEPEEADIEHRSKQKSPFDDTADLEGDSTVTSDGTQESHLGDTGVTCHGIEGSHASINQDSPTKTYPSRHPADAEQPSVADGMDGWDELIKTDQGSFLWDIGVRSIAAAREFLHLSLSELKDEWEKVDRGRAADPPAMLIANLRKRPKARPSAPGAPESLNSTINPSWANFDGWTPPAEQDTRRPAFISVDRWTCLREVAMQLLDGATLDEKTGQVECVHPLLTAQLHRDYGRTLDEIAPPVETYSSEQG